MPGDLWPIEIKATPTFKGSALPDGEHFAYYRIGRSYSIIDFDTVHGTRDDDRAWTAAAGEYESVLSTAAGDLLRARHLWSRWRRLLPGHPRRVEQAEVEYRRRTEAARAAYQPVLDELDRRQQSANAERARHRVEQERAYAAREAAEARRQERLERRREVAAKAMWGWEVTGPDTVRVFHNEGQPPPPLGAKALEKALLALFPSRVEWDADARQTAAGLCLEPSDHGTEHDFRAWWTSVTWRKWDDPSTIPGPLPPRMPPTRTSTDNRPHGTSHHSSYGVGGFSGGGGY